MKKTAYYYLSLAAIVAGGLVSCQDENQGFTQDEISYAATQRDYTKNFIAKYGEIDPNHTWGFGSSATRATTDPLHAYYKIENRNNLYNDNLGSAKSTFSIGRTMTDEEFYYFRSIVPPVVTEEEARYVCQYIYDHSNEGYTTELFTSYFIQAVGKVQHTYDCPGKAEKSQGCGNMEYLWVDQEHNNDYNGTNCGWVFRPTNDGLQKVSGESRVESLVVRSATTSPCFKETFSNNPSSTYNEVPNQYRYYKIEWPIGSGTYGTYLGFDYAALGEKPITGDGHYDDWVVKITDAHRATNRVFCEDLGSIHDWDFNDLVFDYTIESGWVYIDVLAFSGTLPLGSDFGDGKNKILIESHEPEGAEPDHAFLPKEATVLKSYKFASDYTDITDFAFWAVHNSTTQWVGGTDDHDDIPVEARWVIRNQSGCAPYMIQVPTTVDWPDEEQEIGDKYPKFKTWVGNNGNGQTEWWK